MLGNRKVRWSYRSATATQLGSVQEARQVVGFDAFVQPSFKMEPRRSGWRRAELC